MNGTCINGFTERITINSTTNTAKAFKKTTPTMRQQVKSGAASEVAAAKANNDQGAGG